MYEIKNKKHSLTIVSLPGRGIHLEKLGSDGSTATIRDREAKEATVLALVRTKMISMSKLDGKSDPPEDPKSKSFLEAQRIQAVRTAQQGAKARAAGKGRKG